MLERACAEGTTSFAAANRLGDELAAETHPIWGDRASRIIDWMTLPTRRAAGALSSTPARAEQLPGWARREFGRHHWPTVLDAGRALASHDAAAWIGDIDVPTAVVLTEQDFAVPPDDQRAMAAQIPGAEIHALDAGHLACMMPDFGQTMLEACQGVAARAANAVA